MLPYLTEHYGNPSGVHALARRARAAVEDARDVVADLLEVDRGRVVFTGGGTESCNLGVLGGWRAVGGKVLSSAVEHPAVLRACRSTGAAATIPVDRVGVVDLDALAGLLGPEVGLVSLMLANNETGVVQPVAAVAALVRELAPRALVHTDAVGVGAWLDLAPVCAAADLVSLGAHKFGGPKGVGALVVGAGVQVEPVLHGGPQERERRPGTHDVAGIVGMAAALDSAVGHRAGEGARVTRLRDRLAEGLCRVPGVVETVVRPRAEAAPDGCDRLPLLPGTCHVCVDGVDQQELLVLLDDGGVCASAGSACASGALEASHVLLAMGLTDARAKTAVRFSLGWSTTPAEIEHALVVVPKAVARLRA